ncbi:MAG: HAMP domain-containing protein [Nostoc sp. DedQUE12a]|nr:HAMP domain-containing protein [Nostoc sp. DedQUE12a]
MHKHWFFYPPAWPIAAKISIALVCAVLIPMIFTACYNLQQSLNSVEAGEYSKLELLASSFATRFDQLIIDRHRVVTQASSDRYVVDFLAATTSQRPEVEHRNLQQTIENLLRSYSDVDAVLLIDKNGQCLAATDAKFIGQNYSDLEVMVRAKQPGHVISESRSQIIGFAPLATQPWILGVNQPKGKFIAPLNRLIWLHGTSVGVVGGITVIIAVLLGLSISRPIHALTITAQALEYDNFDADVLELHHNLAKFGHSQDDIGQLVRVFLEMAEEVRMRDQKLKVQVEELRIEIDESKRATDVAEITENENFRQLQKKLLKLKEFKPNASETETQYYQRLQTQVQSLKERSLFVEGLNLTVDADEDQRTRRLID